MTLSSSNANGLTSASSKTSKYSSMIQGSLLEIYKKLNVAGADAQFSSLLNEQQRQILRDFLAVSVGAISEQGFSEAIHGILAGSNDLERTNWFNGRYLTAEAFERQDIYFDKRIRLNSRACPPGIAWGLQIKQNPINITEITLNEGLAFDAAGRPIRISTPFTFVLKDLIAATKKLSSERMSSTGTGSLHRSAGAIPVQTITRNTTTKITDGAYLLVIEPDEEAIGQARVKGQLGEDDAGEGSKSDRWQGRFGLSLVRFEHGIHGGLPTEPMALRGALAADFFDRYEQPLHDQWQKLVDAYIEPKEQWPPDGEWQVNSVVPLALLYLTNEKCTVFDQWIPRRVICESQGEDWHRASFGAPPRASCWARLHQFQAMLAESVKNNSNRTNLLEHGFKHLPPIGFLPVLGQSSGDTTSVERAIQEARAYFEGTNVCVYSVVALHEDDIFEDIGNVIDKKPIVLQETSIPAAINTINFITVQNIPSPPTESVLQGILSALLNWAEQIPVQQLKDLIGPLEYVKLVVPINPTATHQNEELLPRSFVVYVKQRMVVLAQLTKILESVLALVSTIRSADKQPIATTTAVYRSAYGRQQPVVQQTLKSNFANRNVQAFFLKVAGLVDYGMVRPDRCKRFLDEVSAESQDQRLKMLKRADEYAAEYTDFQFIQMLLGILDIDDVLLFLKSAAQAPITNANQQTLLDDYLFNPSPSQAEGDEESPLGVHSFPAMDNLVLYSKVRRLMDERKVEVFLTNVNPAIRNWQLGKLLNTNLVEAQYILGDSLEVLKKEFNRVRSRAINPVNVLVGGIDPRVRGAAKQALQRIGAKENESEVRATVNLQLATTGGDGLADRLDNLLELLEITGWRQELLSCLPELEVARS